MPLHTSNMNFAVEGSGVIGDLNFSGVVTLLSKERSFDYDKGICNIYLIKVTDVSSQVNGDHSVYRDGAKFIQTIVAPCLGNLGLNLSLHGKYKLKGLIVRDDVCGTTWEFNPLLAKTSKNLEYLKVSGSGRIATVNLALATPKGIPGQDEILVNNDPLGIASLVQFRLIVHTGHRDRIDWKVVHGGSIIRFCGKFIGEETDSGIIRLLVSPDKFFQ